MTSGEGRRSLIAGANAWFRRMESARPPGERILEDGWAQHLVDRDPRIQVVRLAVRLGLLRRAIDELQVAHCVRHHAIDELLLRAVERDGFRQVVVFGSGYDMRPSRFAERLKGVRWIEVDHPATQARKWMRLAGVAPVRPVERIAADLGRESVSETLARAALEPNLPTCFLLEGIVHYLTAAWFRDLVATAAAVAATSRLIASVIDESMRARASRTLRGLMRLVGERPRTFFQPSAVQAMWAAHRFGDFRSWTFSEQLADFVPDSAAARLPTIPAAWQTVVQATRP